MTLVQDITIYATQEYYIYDKEYSQLAKMSQWTEDKIDPIGDFLAFRYPSHQRVILEEDVFTDHTELYDTIGLLAATYGTEIFVHAIEGHPKHGGFSYSVVNGIPARLLGFAIFIRRSDLDEGTSTKVQSL